MPAALLMLQGTGSDVGKSALVAGLCRLFYRRGLRVAPFKAQNMALNSFITASGAEIGRAQAVQAEACKLPPDADMNPVLIKPNSDIGAQVIVNGRPIGNMSAALYHDYKKTAWQAVKASFERLRDNFELVIIEGAGSPAEINLRDRDIVNMGLALPYKIPVVLVGDIDRGGVFASLAGTLELIAKEERELVKTFIINKFRGDVELLRPGIEMISRHCRVPIAGVVPWFGPEIYLPEEDGVVLEKKALRRASVRAGNGRSLRIGVIRVPHISNFTDFDPLLQEEGVELEYLEPRSPLAGFHLVILPGSKNTLDDLNRLTAAGLPARLRAFVAAGGAVAGICGGYQMMGESLLDPQGVESGHGEICGLGLLPLKTEMQPEKITVQCRARVNSAWLGENIEVSGYEIHQGRTACLRPLTGLLEVKEPGGRVYEDGYASADGRIWGSYLHGIFDNDEFRRAYLDSLAERYFAGADHDSAAGIPASYARRKEEGLEALADLLAEHLDIELLARIAGL